jgi:hypothetical protein
MAAVREVLTEQFRERVVAEPGLLHAEDVGLALVQPRQQAWQPLLDRVHVPGHTRTAKPQSAIGRPAVGEAAAEVAVL